MGYSMSTLYLFPHFSRDRGKIRFDDFKHAIVRKAGSNEQRKES